MTAQLQVQARVQVQVQVQVQVEELPWMLASSAGECVCAVRGVCASTLL